MTILETKKSKLLFSTNYNYYFNKETGFFLRWGQTKEDDPEWSKYGPEILDLEISTGTCLGKCNFCYKTNGTPNVPTKHMSLETFKTILDRMPKTLTQIAFGLTDIKGNPDFFDMIEYANTKGVKCNYTTHGLDVTPNVARSTAKNCGAVAVSIVNKDKSYNAVQMYTNEGMDQVNIHCMFSKERLKFAHALIDDIGTDVRLSKLNAIVFLQYKPKGSNTDKFTCPSVQDFEELIDHCNRAGVAFGFDSCSAPMYLKAIKDSPNYKVMSQYAEPCESGLFSSYINVDGRFYVCSFAEGVSEWIEGINVLDYPSFIDVWYHPKVEKWRRKLLENKRHCPLYNLG